MSPAAAASAFGPVVAVDTAPALAELVRDATARRRAVVDYGQAHRGLGHPPPAEHVHVAFMGRAVEHHVRDFTAAADTGLTIGEFQTALRAQRQWLPVDADADLTLAECIAHHVYGPMRLAYGSWRDLLLGAQFVDGQGQSLRVGGRTVKNVAGYDVTRFLAGGLNQFGLLHRVTLRTSAIPEEVRVVEVEAADPARLCREFVRLMLSNARPAAADFRLVEGRWRARLAYHGTAAGNRMQVEALGPLLADLGCGAVWSDCVSEGGRAAEAAAWPGPWRRRHGAVVKVVTAPTHTAAVARALAEQGAHDVEALPAHGCVFAGAPDSAQCARQLDRAARASVADEPGFGVWHSRPEGVGIDPFWPEPSDLPLLVRVKRALDPDDTLNPGRCIPRQGGEA